MKLKQLSLFLENEPKHLKAPCHVMANEGINILTLSLADTDQFGILRLLVDDWEKAVAALEKAGHAVTVTDVLAIEIDDRPGGLAGLLDIIDQAGLNIEYVYAFPGGTQGKAILVFRFGDPDAAIANLQGRGLKVL